MATCSIVLFHKWSGSNSIIPMSIWIVVMVSHFSWSGKQQRSRCTGGAARRQPLGFVVSQHICNLRTVLCECKSFDTHASVFFFDVFIVVVYLYSSAYPEQPIANGTVFASKTCCISVLRAAALQSFIDLLFPISKARLGLTSIAVRMLFSTVRNETGW